MGAAFCLAEAGVPWGIRCPVAGPDRGGNYRRNRNFPIYRGRDTDGQPRRPGRLRSNRYQPVSCDLHGFCFGFMAEDAFARIQLAGKKIFRSSGSDDVG